jgi:hypothetical protein
MDEKMVIQDNFREPMHVRVPFPPWAMRRDEVAQDADTGRSGAEEIPTY